MKIMEENRFGPVRGFTDAHIYWTMYNLYEGYAHSRKGLAALTGLTEGRIKSILNMLKEKEMITTTIKGITVTDRGQEFIEGIPIRPADTHRDGNGDFVAGVIVSGVSSNVSDGTDVRDDGIRAGADKCALALIRNGAAVLIPPWDLCDDFLYTVSEMVSRAELVSDDVLIMCSSGNVHIALNSATALAMNLI